jgi:hypothetical protein
MTGAVAPADEHEQIVAERLQSLIEQHHVGRAA